MQVCLLFKIFVIFAEGHARFVNLFVLLFVWFFTVYLLKLFCSATVPLCDTIVLSRARHIRLTSIDTSKWYWDGNSLYRKMTFPKFSAPVCSCIHQTLVWLNLLSLGTKGLTEPTIGIQSGLCHGRGLARTASQQHSLTTLIRHFVSIKLASTLFSCIVYTDLWPES
jgi:hypothetical protein